MNILPDEGGFGLALGVAKVKDQGQIAVVDSDTGDIDDARDALLLLYEHGESDIASVHDVPWTLLKAGT